MIIYIACTISLSAAVGVIAFRAGKENQRFRQMEEMLDREKSHTKFLKSIEPMCKRMDELGMKEFAPCQEIEQRKRDNKWT